MLVLNLDLKAQDSLTVNKHQVQIGYTLDMLNDFYAQAFVSSKNVYLYHKGPGRNNKAEFKSENGYSALVVSYSHTFNKRGALGIAMTSQFRKTHYNYLGDGQKSPRVQKEQIYTFTPNIYFNYLQSTIVQLYLGIDIGVLYYTAIVNDEMGNRIANRYNKWMPYFNICPIGLRLKHKFSPYVQANLGSRGFLEGGFSYRF